MDSEQLEEIITKVGLCFVGAFIVSTYLSWSDSQVFRLLGYDASLANDVTFFTRILCMFGGSIVGVLLGLLGYIPKVILMSIGNAANNGTAYKILGFFCPAIGTAGGAALAVQYILNWIA